MNCFFYSFYLSPVIGFNSTKLIKLFFLLLSKMNSKEVNINKEKEEEKEEKNDIKSIPPLQRGYVRLILGPMFAGKTTTMEIYVNNHTFAGKKTCIIKHSNDNRYNSDIHHIITHGGIKIKAHACDTLLSLITSGQIKKGTVDVIGIDEGQFFEDLYLFTMMVVEDFGMTVIIAALDGTFERKPYGEDISKLIPMADKVKKMTAICMICKSKPAIHSKRCSEETELCVIGGEEKYKAVCRACFLDIK